MATVAARPTDSATVVRALPGRRYDHVFFATTSWLMLITVVVGFGPTYYFAGMVNSPLPSLIVHLHAIAFSSWILLLVTQTSLVSAGRVDIHRRLGIGGFFLACLMVVLGLLAATDSLVREAGPVGRDPKFFYIIPTSDMLVFAILIFLAFRNRTNPPAHKRLIYVGTSSLLIAAIARWPFALVHRRAPVAGLFVYVFLLLLAAYDLWSMRKIHRVTLWASAFLIFVFQVRLVIGKTAAWHSFASWVQALAR